jgi:site-specific DNA-methyltransferase (adenine-specific)/adenine-specific DNA-methyltransferase
MPEKCEKDAKTFATFNTGVYDFAKMQELNRDKYIEFVLELFEVTLRKF